MIKKSGSYVSELRENMRGGDGAVNIETLLTPSEMYDKGRLFAKMTLNPGSSIGPHVHEGEMEAFYILSGEAEYYDNGKTVTLQPGDAALNFDGEEHSIKSVGATPLELIATILLK